MREEAKYLVLGKSPTKEGLNEQELLLISHNFVHSIDDKKLYRALLYQIEYLDRNNLSPEAIQKISTEKLDIFYKKIRGMCEDIINLINVYLKEDPNDIIAQKLENIKGLMHVISETPENYADALAQLNELAESVKIFSEKDYEESIRKVGRNVGIKIAQERFADSISEDNFNFDDAFTNLIRIKEFGLKDYDANRGEFIRLSSKLLNDYKLDKKMKEKIQRIMLFFEQEIKEEIDQDMPLAA